MVDQSGLLTELFGSMAVRTIHVREAPSEAGAVLEMPRDGASDDYAHLNLAARSGHFHLLLDGEAALRGREGAPLHAGNMVLFPPANPIDSVTSQQDIAVVCTGACRWITGNFSAGNPATSRLLQGLPTLLELRGEEGCSAMVQDLLPLMRRELVADAPASRAILNGAFHILFVETLRHFIGSHSHNAVGWFRASLDPDIGPVLLLLHARPEEPWTVATMAEQALMSRSSFAAKFNELVGEPPLQYLTKYRMDKARMLLCDETQPVKEIARTVGYISEAAFSTAFRRTEGIAPGSVRKIARSSAVTKGNAAPAA